MNDFLRAYITAALWSSNDESRDDGGDPLDKNYDVEDLAPSCLLAMTRNCEQFQKENAADLALVRYGRGEWSDDEMSGHDFWLTSAGHGAGFWDRGLGELGDRLSEACKKFSVEFTGLYVGDDGLIYLAGRENES